MPKICLLPHHGSNCPLPDLRFPSPGAPNQQIQTPADITLYTSSQVSSQSLCGLHHPLPLHVYHPLVLKTRLHYQGYPLLSPTSTPSLPVSVSGASGSPASVVPIQASSTYQVSASHDGGDGSSVCGPERFRECREET